MREQPTDPNQEFAYVDMGKSMKDEQPESPQS